MLDHVRIPVHDLDASRTFYEPLMNGLGAQVVFELPGLLIYGTEDGAVALGEQDDFSSMHVAFRTDRAGVDAFYAAAMAGGAVDNGEPGLRPHYHENYYAAFVNDPNGHNIEAVCHQPQA